MFKQILLQSCLTIMITSSFVHANEIEEVSNNEGLKIEYTLTENKSLDEETKSTEKEEEEEGVDHTNVFSAIEEIDDQTNAFCDAEEIDDKTNALCDAEEIDDKTNAFCVVEEVDDHTSALAYLTSTEKSEEQSDEEKVSIV